MTELLGSPDNLYESRLIDLFGQTVPVYWVNPCNVPEDMLDELSELARIKNEETIEMVFRLRDTQKGNLLKGD